MPHPNPLNYMTRYFQMSIFCILYYSWCVRTTISNHCAKGVVYSFLDTLWLNTPVTYWWIGLVFNWSFCCFKDWSQASSPQRTRATGTSAPSGKYSMCFCVPITLALNLAISQLACLCVRVAQCHHIAVHKAAKYNDWDVPFEISSYTRSNHQLESAKVKFSVGISSKANATTVLLGDIMWDYNLDAVFLL